MSIECGKCRRKMEFYMYSFKTNGKQYKICDVCRCASKGMIDLQSKLNLTQLNKIVKIQQVSVHELRGSINELNTRMSSIETELTKMDTEFSEMKERFKDANVFHLNSGEVKHESERLECGRLIPASSIITTALEKMNVPLKCLFNMKIHANFPEPLFKAIGNRKQVLLRIGRVFSSRYKKTFNTKTIGSTKRVSDADIKGGKSFYVKLYPEQYIECFVNEESFETLRDLVLECNEPAQWVDSNGHLHTEEY
jgi:hypothetical protein